MHARWATTSGRVRPSRGRRDRRTSPGPLQDLRCAQCSAGGNRVMWCALGRSLEVGHVVTFSRTVVDRAERPQRLHSPRSPSVFNSGIGAGRAESPLPPISPSTGASETMTPDIVPGWFSRSRRAAFSTSSGTKSRIRPLSKRWWTVRTVCSMSPAQTDGYRAVNRPVTCSTWRLSSSPIMVNIVCPAGRRRQDGAGRKVFLVHQ